MKVLHVIPSLSLKQGGPSFAMPLIARSLVDQGVHVDIATTNDDGPGCHLHVPLEQPIGREGYRTFYFHKQIDFYKVSLPFSRWMAQHAKDYDLVHIHALFSYTSNSAARHVRRCNIPYLVRPLGVLNRWGMENRRRFLKSLSFRFVETPVLHHAAAMHYTSRQEQVEAEATGATARPLVVPLGLDLAPFQQLPDPELFFRQYPAARGRKLLLFLSRIDAKKGLDLLFLAFARLRQTQPEVRLVIVGSGSAEVVKKFQGLAAEIGISDGIIWTGFLDGQDKLAVLAAAQVFVLPSYSENFGIAAVEALAAGLPCVLSSGVAVGEDVKAAEAGLVVPPKPDALAAALVQLFSDNSLREACARNARALALDRFSLEAMGKGLFAAYQEILASPV